MNRIGIGMIKVTHIFLLPKTQAFFMLMVNYALLVMTQSFFQMILFTGIGGITKMDF